MNKLQLINSIPILEDSASCGELEYVLVQDNAENREKLRMIGVPDVEISEMSNGEEIDIAGFGFVYCGAKWFEKRLGGFLDYVPDHAPDWAKV
jgi:hypothetical protein